MSNDADCELLVDGMVEGWCPLSEGPGGRHSQDGPHSWDSNRTCSYCGSMHPDDFMQHLEAGNVELGTTTKDYKVYVSGKSLLPGQLKFYFRHLPVADRRRFVELINERKLVFQGGFGFNPLPFFARYIPAEERDST